MPETIGTIILTAAGGGFSISGGLGASAGVGFLGFSASTTATFVGSAAIIGASIGLQYLLNHPNVPKPEEGSQPLKQATPPRQRGYWDCRLAGYYMLFENGNRDSQDVTAFHSGKVESIRHVYLHDQEVSVLPDVSGGGIGTVQTVGADQFAGGRVQVDFKLGATSQTASTLLTSDPNINSIWTSAYKGNGIAYGVLKCGAVVDPELYSRTYPQGLPLMSVVARCSPVWDSRDGSQDRNNPATWVASPNPVLQLIDYLTTVDGGMGEDLDEILPPERLAEWMTEANLCVGRYNSAGWYQFDNNPEEVVNKILATCDGWMSEDGEGGLVLTVGVYREPTDPPLTEKHILGFSVNYGIADEQLINQLDVSFTDPALKYASRQIDPVRDEESISLVGIVRAKPLDLSWVQDATQAELLGERAMLRLNPAKSGTLVTTPYGKRYLGKRWVKIQYPFVRGLEDCVVEIQDRAEVDLLGGTVTFNWNLIDPIALAAL
jgi:hypothetical protein